MRAHCWNGATCLSCECQLGWPLAEQSCPGPVRATRRSFRNVANSERYASITRILSPLSTAQRRMATRLARDGVPIASIAKRLGCHHSVVRSWLSLGLWERASAPRDPARIRKSSPFHTPSCGGA